MSPDDTFRVSIVHVELSKWQIIRKNYLARFVKLRDFLIESFIERLIKPA